VRNVGKPDRRIQLQAKAGAEFKLKDPFEKVSDIVLTTASADELDTVSAANWTARRTGWTPSTRKARLDVICCSHPALCEVA